MKKYLILFLIPFLVLVPSAQLFAQGSNTIGSYFGFYPQYSLNVPDYESSDIYVNGTTVSFGNAEIDCSFVSSLVLPDIDISSYTKVCVVSTDSGIYVLLGDPNTYFIKTYSSTIGVCCLLPQNGSYDDNFCALYYDSNYNFVERVNIASPSYIKTNVPYAYCGFDLPLNVYRIAICSNTELYGINFNNIPSSWGSFIGQDYYEVFAAAHHQDFDYGSNKDIVDSFYYNTNYIDQDLNGGSSGGENASNNLYMKDPNWQFKNIPSFGTILDTNSRGQAIFSAQLTDYQKENLNNFRLDFTFNTYWNGVYYSIGSDDVTPIAHNFSKTFLYQVQIPLSDFYSSGSMYSIYIDDIFNNSVSSDTDQTLNDFGNSYKIQYMMNTNNFRTAFTVNLIALDNSGQSGSCTAYYSYKTGTSQTTNNSMGINSNPYVDDDGSASGVTDPTQDPSGSGSGSGVGNVGDGSIVNNNNPVININNNNSLSDGDSDGLISKILLLIANNQSATSSGIEEIADTSGFVDLMGATWLAVPATWWTTLTAAFIASIGILVVGFILKIIIGLIF